MTRAGALLLVITIAVAGLSTLTHSDPKAAPRGALVDQIMFYEWHLSPPLPHSPPDLRLDSLALVDKLDGRLDPTLKPVSSYEFAYDLLLNPVPNNATALGFNPFALRSIREAMNRLIDREFVRTQIFAGFAIPYTSPFYPRQLEYLRQTVFFERLDRAYAADAAAARNSISANLSKIPEMMFRQDGRWHYKNEALTITFIIPIEDRRFDLGNYVADQIETLGLGVIRSYRPAGTALPIVYQGPADVGAWHLYVEKRVLSPTDKWEDEYLRNAYLNDGTTSLFLQYHPPDLLADAAGRLANGDYKDLEERSLLIRKGASLAMSESLRVWIAVQESVFFLNNQVQSTVVGVNSGLLSPLTARTARFANPGGILEIAVDSLSVSPWNPVRGFNRNREDVELSALSDPLITIDPNSEDVLPVRANLTVKTNGVGLAVPPAAVVWNVTRSQFEAVGPNVTARSQVAFDFDFGIWHDGTPMSMDDIWELLSLYYRWQPGGIMNPLTGSPLPPGDLSIDPRAASPTVLAFLSMFKGAMQSDPHTLEVYTDAKHFDPGVTAQQASLWPIVPWEVNELMARTVLDNQTAYDDASAREQGKTALDLVRGGSLTFLDTALATLASAGYIPAGFGGIINSTEAAERWTALQTFRADRGHFLVSNGPFVLRSISPAVLMDRFPGHRDPASRWDLLLTPRVPTILLPDGLNVTARSASTLRFQTFLDGLPYDQMFLQYAIIDPFDGDTVTWGIPIGIGNGTWEISLRAEETASLSPPGPDYHTGLGPHPLHGYSDQYDLRVVGVGNDSAIPVSAIAHVLVKRPEPCPSCDLFLRGIVQMIVDLRRQVMDLQEQTRAANESAARAEATVAELTHLVWGLVFLSVVATAMGVWATVLASRKTYSRSAPRR